MDKIDLLSPSAHTINNCRYYNVLQETIHIVSNVTICIGTNIQNDVTMPKMKQCVGCLKFRGSKHGKE